MQKFRPCRGKDISQSEVETEKIYTGGCPTMGWEPKHPMHAITMTANWKNDDELEDV